MTRVHVVCEVRLFREGLARSLAQERDIRVVGMAPTGLEALPELVRLRPDIVLVSGPVAEGAELIRALAELERPVKVVAIAVRRRGSRVLRHSPENSKPAAGRDPVCGRPCRSLRPG